MRRALPRVPFEGLSLILLLVMMLVATWALVATDWTDHLSLVPLIAFVGVWAGAGLARSRFPGWVAGLFAAAYGLFAIGWQLGGTLDPALPWRGRILSLLGRLGVFVRVLVTGEPNQDPLMFVLLMAALFWSLGVVAAWSVFRRGSFWGAILPGAIAIATFAYFYIGDARLGLFLAVYLFLGLVLALRVNVSQHSAFWRQVRARVPTEAAYRMSMAGLAAAMGVITLAWGAPALAKSEGLSRAWGRIVEPLEGLQDRVGDALGEVRGPVAVLASAYDDVLRLDAGEMPVNRVVMEVDPLRAPSQGGRFYWRSRVYAAYEGGRWLEPPLERVDFDPREGDLWIPGKVGREIVEVRVTPNGPAIQRAYIPPQPLWVDRSAEVGVQIEQGEIIDVLGVVLNRVLREGESYQARASLATPTADELRVAGRDYPDWVTQRYLQIPPEITQRTRELALEITRGLDNPYDQAMAITRWLRTNIEYSRVTEAPPEGVEPVDWFLFDYQVGFCNYYASAEVILLRSLGIPARLAAGYARGEFDSASGIYIVRGEHSHAWPEVYFPGVGWVEFEPTVSQPDLVRPEGAKDREGARGPAFGEDEGFGGPSDDERLESLREQDESLEELGDAPPEANRVRQVLTAMVIGLALVALWVRLDPSRWALATGWFVRGASQLGIELDRGSERTRDYRWETPVGRLYLGWTAWLRRLGLLGGPAQTPEERLQIFRQHLPQAAGPATILVTAYESERFAGTAADLSQARAAWRRMQPALWMAWLWKLTERWRRGDSLRHLSRV